MASEFYFIRNPDGGYGPPPGFNPAPGSSTPGGQFANQYTGPDGQLYQTFYGTNNNPIEGNSPLSRLVKVGETPSPNVVFTDRNLQDLGTQQPGQNILEAQKNPLGTPKFDPGSQQKTSASQQAVIQQPNAQQIQTQAPSTQNYEVKPGDTLSRIAQKFGVSIGDVSGYRSGDPDLIFPGEILRIKKAASPVQPVQQPTGTGTQEIQPAQPGIEPGGIYAQLGIPQTLTETSIEDVIKKISTFFGFDSINGEMKSLDNLYIDDVAEVNENPWITESIRIKESTKLKEKYDAKRDALVRRLSLQGDIVGQAINVYYKERDYQKDLLFKALDLKEKEFARNKLLELSPGATLYDPATGEAVFTAPSSKNVDLLTIKERRELYPDLPISLIGSSEKEILTQLESPVPPSWFDEVALRSFATEGAKSKAWNVFRKKVIEFMESTNENDADFYSNL